MQRSAMWNAAHVGPEQSPTGSQSVQRALVLLNLIGLMGRDRPAGVPLGELARVSGRPKPSVHRAVAALVSAGFVEQNPDTHCYRLGLQSQLLGELAGPRADPITAAAGDSVTRLAVLSEDTAFLTVRQGSYAPCTRREDGGGQIRNHALAVGDRHPLGIGAGSLAILSDLDDTEIDEVLQLNAPVVQRHYPRINEQVLRACVARTREDGYSLNDGLLVPGSWAIGMAVHDAEHRPVAAVSIATIEHRLGRDRREELASAMRHEAQLIESALTPEQTHRTANSRRHP
jgi:DNA-binding IclR family transcriptional regulator